MEKHKNHNKNIVDAYRASKYSWRLSLARCIVAIVALLATDIPQAFADNAQQSVAVRCNSVRRTVDVVRVASFCVAMIVHVNWPYYSTNALFFTHLCSCLAQDQLVRIPNCIVLRK